MRRTGGFEAQPDGLAETTRIALVLSYWNLNRVAFGGGRRIEALLDLLGPRAVLVQPAPAHPDRSCRVFRPDLGRRKIGINWGLFNFWFPGAAAAVRKAVRELQPAVVVLTSVWAWAPLRTMRPRPPAVLDAHDVLAAAIEERYGPRHPFARMVAAWEGTVVRGVDMVVACSEKDAEGFRRRYGVAPDKVDVVPNGADLDFDQRAHASVIEPAVERELAGAEHVLLFMGKLDYQPNRTALRFLADDVLPRLESSGGRWRLLVLGGPIPAGPWPTSFVFAGRVPDVAPYLKRANVCVAPIFSGSGTRLKILEYLAAGRPVVATPKAAEGLAVEHGRHLLLADGTAFAEALVRLARDRGYAEALAQAGRELVATRYSWDASRQRWRQLLARWLEPGGSAAGKSPRAAELARRACRSAEG